MLFSTGRRDDRQMEEPVDAAAFGSVDVEDEWHLAPKERLRSLTRTGETIIVDMHFKPKRYFISGEQLFKTAKYETTHGNFQKSYVLFIRFLTLFVEKLPKHPTYNTIDEEEIRKYKKYIKEAMGIAETLKTKILSEFQKEYEQEEQERLERRRLLMEKHAPHLLSSDGAADFDAVVSQISNINGNFEPSAPPLPQRTEYSWPDIGFNGGNAQSPDEIFGENKALPLGIVAGGMPTAPSFNRSVKPRPRMSGSEILRDVVVPGDLVDKFIQASKKNTQEKNIETCGNLWGIRREGSYIVTHLLIPKQTGTDSYCEDLDEGSEVAQYAISRDLIQLGWIHTHPTQSAFLSSVDLHMQWGYQVMLPEAIAIVVAPTYDDVAFFRLRPYGMDFIGQCPHGTNFHNHETIEPLFERISDFSIDPSLAVNCEDFR